MYLDSNYGRPSLYCRSGGDDETKVLVFEVRVKLSHDVTLCVVFLDGTRILMTFR